MTKLIVALRNFADASKNETNIAAAFTIYLLNAHSALLLLLLLLFITFMQGIYCYVSETNDFYRVYIVTAIL
jgi:hypothetical protein